MRFAFSSFASSSHLLNHHSRRFISRHPLWVIALLSMAAFMAAAVGGPITSSATSSFTAKQDFATGPNPRSVTTGDLNGDGKLDLAVANLNSNNVSVLLNSTVPGAATPNFTPKQDFEAGLGPVSVAIGDLNGDGKLDLMVANFNSNNVSVLLNTTAPGDATASFAGQRDVATSEGPIFVTTGDLNGDGKIDLVVVNLLSNSLSVLLNTTAAGAAAPSFTAKQDFAVGDGPLSVAVGDLNGDGKLDLAVANSNFSNVSVLLNTTAPGSATSSFSTIQDFATGDRPTFVAMGDLNGDGKLDLTVANFGFDTVSVLLNTTAPGSTTASFTVNREFATGTGPIYVTMGDVDSDGKLDLAVANFNSNNVSVLLNTSAPGTATPSFSAKQDFVTSEAPLSLSWADLNGGGQLDLVVANLNASTVSILLNTTDLGAPKASFAAKQDFATGASPRSISIGDLNGDGKLDLAVANIISNTVSVLLNDTDPDAAASIFATKQDFATGTNPASVTMVDLNKDGKLDLAVANISSNTVSLLLNTSAPGATILSFAAKQDFVTGDGPLFVTAGDLNGDGKSDLAVANLVATVSILFNTTASGAATPSFAAKQDFAIGNGPRSVSIGDLNVDGKLDLAVVNFNSNSVVVLLNTTDPGAATPSFSAVHDFPTGIRPSSVAGGDLNGDGKLDLALVNLGSNTVSVLLNTTAPGATISSFSAKQDFVTNFSPASITLGDLSGDGKPDLVAANSNSNNVSVLLNTTTPGTGTLSFAAKQDFDTSNGPVSVAKGDFNGDGKVDLAVANVDSDTVSVLLNNTTLVTATGLSLEQGSATSTLQIATVNSNAVSVTVISANPENGVTISNIVNTDGNIAADIVASCVASTATFTLQARDGSSIVTDTLNINVAPNPAPTLSYQNQTVAFNGKFTIDPATGPADNGRLNAIVKESSGTFMGDISVDGNTGTISISNAAPVGIHTITIRASDNCGSITDASFTLTVGKADQTITFGALANKTLGDPDFAVNATATSDLLVGFAASGQCTVSGNTVHLTAAGSCTITASQGGNSNFNPAPDVPKSFDIASSTPTPTPTPTATPTPTPTPTPTATPTPTPTPNASTVQFLSSVEVEEESERAVVTVTRTGDTSGTASVDYLTTDSDNFTIGCVDTVNNLGAAFGRCDFAISLDRLTFAAGETVKTFDVPIIDDSIPEGRETFSVILSNPIGTTLGSPSSVTVAIVDNETVGAPNPIFDTPFFVRQHYLDFLSREPDQAGFDAWVNLLNNCSDTNNDPTCDRITVSSSFLLSQEFQLKAFYVFRFYKLAFNRLPSYTEMVVDMRAVTGQTSDEVFQKKAAFADAFVQRTEFQNIFGASEFVATLMERNNLTFVTTPDPAAPDGPIKVRLTANELSGLLGSNVITPAQALRAIADSDQVFNLEFNQAFVAMQYFGYLRRTPDTAGFNAWLNFLNTNPADFRTMVNGFMNSSEYRLRFGLQ